MRNLVKCYISVVVLLWTVLSSDGCAAAGNADSDSAQTFASDYAPPEIIGRIEAAEVKESSGLAVSRCQSNVLWTHNDAGSGPFVYAMNSTGKHLGTWQVQNAQNIDWEDIDTFKDAAGKCYLIIGDIGDNDEVRSELTLYRIPEPDVATARPESNTTKPLHSAPAEALKFSYGSMRNNAETLLVHPQAGEIYIVTKRSRGPAAVYKLKSTFGTTGAAAAERIAEISIPSDPPGLLTGGAVSPDGKRVILCDVKNGYELRLPNGAVTLDTIWGQKPIIVNLGDRKQGEGVAYSVDGNAIYASSEKKNAPLFLIKRRQN